MVTNYNGPPTKLTHPSLWREKPVRNATRIEDEDIKDIMSAFHVEKRDMNDIAEQYDVEDKAIYDIVRGKNFGKAMSAAVTDLLAAGHPCDRRIAKPMTGGGPKLSPRQVLGIRMSYLNGEAMDKMLKDRPWLKANALRLIILGTTYGEAEYLPEGWKPNPERDAYMGKRK